MTDLKLWNGGKAEDVIIKDAKNNINKIGNYCLLTQP
jgi:hypothetical protein